VTRPGLREYAALQRERYGSATRAEKGALLDQVVAVIGLHRKAAIRWLRRAPRAPTAGSRAGQPRLYGPAVAPAVEVLWQATEHIGPHRLHRFVPELLDRLAHNGELRLAPEVDQLVRQASPATLGQLLASAPASYFKRPDHERSRGYPPHGRSRSPTAPTAADNERPVAHAFTSTGPGKPSPIPIS